MIKPIRRALIVAVFACAVPASSLAQSTDAQQETFKAWHDCVIAAATRYARTPDSSGEVARVAMIACREKQWAAQKALGRSALDPRGASETVEERRILDIATLHVMELRAGR